MRFSKIVFSAILVLILLIALTPAVLSTKLGNQALSSLLSNDQEVQFTELKLSWFGPQKIQYFFLKKENITVKLEDVAIDSSLPSLIWTKKIGNSRIEKLFLVLNNQKKFSLKQPNLSERDRKYKFVGAIVVNDGEIVYQQANSIEVKIDNLSSTFDPLKKSFSVKGEVEQPKQKGAFSIYTTFGDSINFYGEIQAFPSSIFSAIEELAPLAFLGDTFSGSINLKTNEKQKSLNITAQSDTLSLKAEAIGEENLVFTQDSLLTVTLSPTKLQQIGEAWLSPVTVLEPIVLTIRPHSLYLQKSVKKLSDMQFAAGFDFSTISLLFKEQKYSFNNLHGEILAGAENKICFESDKSFPYPIQINGNLSDKLFLQIKTNDLSSILKKFELPETLDLGNSLTVTLESDGKTISGNGKGDLLNFDFEAKKIQDGYQSKAEGSLLIQPNLQSFFGEKMDFTLEKEIKKGSDHLYVSSLKLYFHNRLGKGIIEGSIGDENHAMSLNSVEAQGNYHLTNLDTGSIVFSLSGRENTLCFTLDFPKLRAKLQANGYLTEGKINRKNTTFHLEATGTEFPTDLIDKILKKQAVLSTLLGPTMDFHLIAIQDPNLDSSIEISYQVDGKGFQSEGTLRANHNLNVSEEAPIFLRYEITPTRYRQLLQRLGKERLPTLILTKPATINLKISKLICPKEELQIKEFLCQTGFEGNIEISPITFVDPDHRETVIFSDTQGKLSGESFSESIQISLQSTMNTPSENAYSQAHFSLTADLIDLFKNDGSIDHENATLKISSHLTPFSTSALLNILPLKQNEREKLYVLFGNSISYTLSSHITSHEGPIALSIDATQLKATCPFYLTKDNRLLLTAALDAQITVTPEISEMFIKDINPLFIAGIYSGHPITLHLSPEGFSLPLSLDLQTISIHQGVLDIGQIFVANGKKVQELMEFLKAKGISQEGNMSAWFTPIYFQLKDGTISYQRFDLLLATNVHLAFWGRINLINDKVQMTLGIAPSTLQRSFNIHGVPSSQMFQIKVQGSTSDVELDWGAATGRIAILVASSSIGQIGTFIGSILEKIYAALGEKPTPPPTTYPFPWSKSSG